MKPHHRWIPARLLDKVLDLPEHVEDYDYEDGIRLIRFAISVRPHEPTPYFYLAVFYSAVNRVAKSLFYYEEALKRGYCDWHRIETDPSFENSRKTAKFKIITERYRACSLGSSSA